MAYVGAVAALIVGRRLSPVKTLVDLSLAPEHRRGHGALYGALNHGRLDVSRLRRTLAGLPLPRAADGRIMLAADVSNWLRPVDCSPYGGSPPSHSLSRNRTGERAHRGAGRAEGACRCRWSLRCGC
ncbi:transposase [Streptomyces sp. NBC_00873]|nr:transposase [Streptomyces sp. NBC_00873]WTA48906.1 transposase [Streptomyces sp. NBC_00842]